MDEQTLLDAVDAHEALEFLAAMVRFRSYSETPGEAELARFMVGRARLANRPRARPRLRASARGAADARSGAGTR